MVLPSVSRSRRLRSSSTQSTPAASAARLVFGLIPPCLLALSPPLSLSPPLCLVVLSLRFPSCRPFFPQQTKQPNKKQQTNQPTNQPNKPTYSPPLPSPSLDACFMLARADVCEARCCRYLALQALPQDRRWWRVHSRHTRCRHSASIHPPSA